MLMTHVKLRELFSNFWKQRNHKEIPPIPLIPQNDPTTLFTGSGMQQLVPNLLGEIHPLGKRLFNIQRCIRAQDIEEVGDNRHDTFFEMMGNWSLGDYFKEEQLSWFWEFLTKELLLPKEKLYVTIFGGTKEIPADEESFQVWKKIGLRENRIFRYDTKTNWWSRAGEPKNMPTGEPGGRTSEVFYEFTDVPHNPQFGEKCHPNCDCGRFLEIGNSVFMEFKKNADGSLSELPAKNVDFGGGVERITMAIENKNDLFLTNLFQPIITQIELISNKEYKKNKKQMRIIADHIKTSIFLINEDILPSNKEQGYILRRLIRRSVFFGNNYLNISYFTKKLFNSIATVYKETYPELFKKTQDIEFILDDEEKKFFSNIGSGQKTVDRELLKLGYTSSSEISPASGATIAFNAFQNSGFFPEMTYEYLEEKGFKINKRSIDSVYKNKLKEHKQISKKGVIKKFRGGLADHSEQTIKYHTATHLLHQALFDVLGKEVRQEGSNITVERLRFDFSSPVKPTYEQIKKAELIINKKIKESLPVSFKIIPRDEAYKIGARSFFREKYPDMVKVYFLGDYSKEFCGGPHVKNTSEIGQIKIFKFEKIGSNLYRIYAK